MTEQTPATPDVEGLVKRLKVLREWRDGIRDRETITLSIAALERLSAEREGLREALEAFARYHDLNDCGGWDVDDTLDVPVRDLRRARAALSTQGESRQTGEEPVGAAEREVGRAVYERIEKLMDANPKPHTSEWAELTFVSLLAETVEEYGSYDGPTCLLALPAAPTPAPAVTTEST
jgi:hypothetical protein